MKKGGWQIELIDPGLGLAWSFETCEKLGVRFGAWGVLEHPGFDPDACASCLAHAEEVCVMAK